MYGNGNGQVGPGRREPIFGTGSLFGGGVKHHSDFSRAIHERNMPKADMKKGGVAPSPIERESNIDMIEPTNDWLAHSTRLAKNQLKADSSTVGRAFIEKQDLKRKLESLEGEQRENFIHDYYNWLAGVGKEEDYIKSGLKKGQWGQGKLISRHDSVVGLLEAKVARHGRYLADIAKMKMRGPGVGRNGGEADSHDTFLYFKYIIRNMPVNTDDFWHLEKDGKEAPEAPKVQEQWTMDNERQIKLGRKASAYMNRQPPTIYSASAKEEKKLDGDGGDEHVDDLIDMTPTKNASLPVVPAPSVAPSSTPAPSAAMPTAPIVSPAMTAYNKEKLRYAGIKASSTPNPTETPEAAGPAKTRTEQMADLAAQNKAMHDLINEYGSETTARGALEVEKSKGKAQASGKFSEAASKAASLNASIAPEAPKNAKKLKGELAGLEAEGAGLKEAQTDLAKHLIGEAQSGLQKEKAAHKDTKASRDLANSAVSALRKREDQVKQQLAESVKHREVQQQQLQQHEAAHQQLRTEAHKIISGMAAEKAATDEQLGKAAGELHQLYSREREMMTENHRIRAEANSVFALMQAEAAQKAQEAEALRHNIQALQNHVVHSDAENNQKLNALGNMAKELHEREQAAIAYAQQQEQQRLYVEQLAQNKLSEFAENVKGMLQRMAEEKVMRKRTKKASRSRDAAMEEAGEPERERTPEPGDSFNEEEYIKRKTPQALGRHLLRADFRDYLQKKDENVGVAHNPIDTEVATRLLQKDMHKRHAILKGIGVKKEHFKDVEMNLIHNFPAADRDIEQQYTDPEAEHEGNVSEKAREIGETIGKPLRDIALRASAQGRVWTPQELDVLRKETVAAVRNSPDLHNVAKPGSKPLTDKAATIIGEALFESYFAQIAAGNKTTEPWKQAKKKIKQVLVRRIVTGE